MTTNALEILHRSVISKLNKTRGEYGLFYHKDVVIESAILPLVELLNNEWSLTTHSCCGQWDPKPRFQYPYVSFHVFANRTTWQSIVRKTWQFLEPELGRKLTITVEDYYKLPELCPIWSCWRFRPKITGTSTWEKALNIFRSGKAFRRELDSLIGKAVSALRIEIDRERRHSNIGSKVKGEGQSAIRVTSNRAVKSP